MTSMARGIAGLAVLALVAPALTHAAEVSVGQLEYENKCATCHGVSGKGDGWLSAYLKQRPPSLTQLQRRNGGVFPFDDVYQTIDGRKDVRIHGPREMPVWGSVYRMQSDTIFGTQLDQRFADIMARMRMLALIEHISRLQE